MYGQRAGGVLVRALCGRLCGEGPAHLVNAVCVAEGSGGRQGELPARVWYGGQFNRRWLAYQDGIGNPYGITGGIRDSEGNDIHS